MFLDHSAISINIGYKSTPLEVKL